MYLKNILIFTVITFNLSLFAHANNNKDYFKLDECYYSEKKITNRSDVKSYNVELGSWIKIGSSFQDTDSIEENSWIFDIKNNTALNKVVFSDIYFEQIKESALKDCENLGICTQPVKIKDLAQKMIKLSGLSVKNRFNGKVGIGEDPAVSLHVVSSDEVVARFKSSDNKAVIEISDDDADLSVLAGGLVGASEAWSPLRVLKKIRGIKEPEEKLKGLKKDYDNAVKEGRELDAARIRNDMYRQSREINKIKDGYIKKT